MCAFQKISSALERVGRVQRRSLRRNNNQVLLSGEVNMNAKVSAAVAAALSVVAPAMRPAQAAGNNADQAVSVSGETDKWKFEITPYASVYYTQVLSSSQPH
jgi:hypothetical protein